jgi:hypothetical protein
LAAIRHFLAARRVPGQRLQLSSQNVRVELLERPEIHGDTQSLPAFGVAALIFRDLDNERWQTHGSDLERRGAGGRDGDVRVRHAVRYVGLVDEQCGVQISIRTQPGLNGIDPRIELARKYGHADPAKSEQGLETCNARATVVTPAEGEQQLARNRTYTAWRSRLEKLVAQDCVGRTEKKLGLLSALQGAVGGLARSRAHGYYPIRPHCVRSPAVELHPSQFCIQQTTLVCLGGSVAINHEAVGARLAAVLNSGDGIVSIVKLAVQRVEPLDPHDRFTRPIGALALKEDANLPADP